MVAPPTICQVCAVPLAGHLRCSDCTILVGPEHIEIGLIRGRCSDCTSRRPTRTTRHLRYDDGRKRHTYLAANDVREIRRQLSLGVSQLSLAARYDVSPPTIHNVHAGHTWKGVR